MPMCDVRPLRQPSRGAVAICRAMFKLGTRGSSPGDEWASDCDQRRGVSFRCIVRGAAYGRERASGAGQT
eukprot:3662930-Prymnesium_polylepis.2